MLVSNLDHNAMQTAVSETAYCGLDLVQTSFVLSVKYGIVCTEARPQCTKILYFRKGLFTKFLSAFEADIGNPAGGPEAHPEEVTLISKTDFYITFQSRR